MNVIFDTQEIYRGLAEEDGFSTTHVDSLMAALRKIVALSIENVATKSGVQSVKSDVKVFKSDVQVLKSDVKALTTER